MAVFESASVIQMMNQLNGHVKKSQNLIDQFCKDSSSIKSFKTINLL